MAKKTNLKMWVLMAVLLVGMAPAIAAGGTIYVDADASPGGDGSSWGTAYKYLQDALDKPPTSGDEIWVAEGTYKPEQAGDREATFQLISGVALYGGFAGGESTLDERDVVLYETILSGDIGTEGVNTDNSFHVVTGSGTEPNAVLDGFTITAGNANGPSPDSHGGGMFNYSGSSPTLTNCTFSGNSAGDRGGGMYNVESSTTVTNCTFSGNSASSGGGMHNYNNSSPTVTNCTFSGNSVVYSGGGMYNDKSSPTVTNCTFSENSTHFSGGGGMFNYKSTNPTLTNCIFWGDTAPTAPEIRNYQSSPTVTYSDIAGSGGSSSWDLSLGTDGGGNIDADPLFADADLRLSVGSPCIDAGDNTAVPGGVTTDLDGNPRFVDDPDTTDTGNGTPPIVDMGAYEYQGPPAPIIYVDADASPGGDGTSWATAYKYLQDALYKPPTSGDEIWVAGGTYKPDEDEGGNVTLNDRTATFQLINGVGIYGGFAATESKLDERDWQTNETILSGDIGTEGVNTDNSYHVVTGRSGTNDTAVLDGFTITAGNANGFVHPDSDGGGMFNDSSSPTVTNCTFSGNSASNNAGGMYNYNNSSPMLTNCTFSGNSAMGTYATGGGMYNNSSSPMLTNCTFSGNSASNRGGGMNNVKSSPTLTKCTFTANRANWGGGMANWTNSSPTLTSCTFTGNWARFTAGVGGGDGGGMLNLNSSPTLMNCTFTGNLARLTTGFGGGDGGGMYNYNNSPMLTNCTFSGNEAGSHGGGMYNQSSSATLTNCILWGDSAPTGLEIYNDGTSSATVSYSDVQGGWGGTENIDEDPVFIDPNGLDGIAGTEDDNLRLSAGSPCIDAGDNTAVPAGVTTDLDGNPRFVDHPVITDTGNGTPPIVDMGAYEYQPTPPSIIYVDADATAGANNGTSWENAYLYLQDALDDPCLLPVSEIWVAQGIYKPDAKSSNPGGSGARTATFQLINGVAIYGGYAGVGEPDPNERDVEQYKTLLSGDIGTAVINTDNSYNVVTGSGTEPNAVLDGFTITAGNANGSYPHSCAGGLFNDSGSPTVTNCTFRMNRADNSGGGMYNRYSAPTVTNCIFSVNSAGSYGGAMRNYQSSPALTNCTLIGNSANSGGGMGSSNSSRPTVTNCTFSGNSAKVGGGLYNWNNGSPTVSNCILWGNIAGSGAQIYNDGTGSATVSYSDVEGGYNGNMNADPLFVDANGPDGIAGTEDDNLHLRGYSPCINAGDPSGDYSGQVDMDGVPRVLYSTVDMGADEVYPIAGDFEPDEDVDPADLQWLADRWLNTPCDGTEWCDGADIDMDNTVDFIDFAYFSNHWLLGVSN